MNLIVSYFSLSIKRTLKTTLHNSTIISSMEKNQLTRQELYDLVWAEPLSQLAKKYNISDNGLRKICLRMKIPLPLYGHWQKIRYGKPVTVLKLRDNYSGKDVIILNEKGSEYNCSVSPLTVQTRIKKEIESVPDLPLRVPERLTNPDILIINTKNYFEAVSRFDRNRDSYSNYPAKNNVLNIDVSKESMPRALRLLNAVIKLLRARNHDVQIKNDKTIALIEGEEIEFRLREKNRVSVKKTVEWGTNAYESTGEFVFVIGDYIRKEIKDGVDSLETKLSTILAKLESEGKGKKECRIANELRHKEQEVQLQIERGIKERKEKESRNFKDLFSKATRLHQANIIRVYIQTIEANAIKNGNMSDELKSRISWANEKVDWYDPLINKKDSLLNDNDKKNFFKEFLKEWQ